MDGLTITGATLTVEACCDVMETAISAGYTHGIGYWADVRQEKYSNPKPPEESRLMWMNIHDREGAGEAEAAPDSHYVTNIYPEERKRRCVGINTGHIQRAVVKMLTDPELVKEGWYKRLLDDDGVDGPLADAIVQVACFGKVIYG